MELKDTLLMPKTPFEMRGNLNVKEPKFIEKWEKMDLYKEMNKDRHNGTFMLHDGPPYANGNIHCGHMLNRLLKDFVIRYKNMCGYETPFIFGWDTHGLPIEVKVTQSGVNRKTTPITEFRSICAEYAKKQVANQKGQVKRLGVMGDYDHPYLTLLKEYEARQIDVFAKMAMKGLIFKGVKPVYWSPSSESALAEAEIEYKDIAARTMYVAFDVADGKDVLPSDAKVVIWTTTPWTIPADLAVTLNPRFEYSLFQTNKGKLLFLTSAKERLVEELGLTECEELLHFHGQDLEYVVLQHPLYANRTSTLIVNSYVTDDSGTGCVHTAPDHGLDDFNACMKYGIKPFCPVDEKGVLRLEEGDPLNGLFYEVANDRVVEMLEANGHLLKEVDIVHSYPHDWRTKKPVIFRATPQWFCSIDPIRQDLLDAIHKIKWVPSWGENKMVNMIKDRADWCISRQRAWGVPLPIIYNEDGSPILEENVFKHIRDLIAEYGSNVWFEKDVKDLLPEGYKNEKSPNGNFTKETDIMDVWFDSGSSWNGVLNERGLLYPADLYLEGNDQYRGWFNASLILSMAVNGVSPFKTCLTHGWVMDDNWQKMSKSSGNGIDPSKIANQFGADLLRLWASLVNYQADVRISESIIQTISETYRKIRNTFKFMLGNLQNGDKEFVLAKNPELSPLDKLIMAELEAVKNRALDAYESYDFSVAVNAIIGFLTGDLSSFYLDVCKDALYCDAYDSKRREAIQYVIYNCTKDICLLLTPVLSFTMDEVYANIPLVSKANPQLDDMPKKSNVYTKEDLETLASLKKTRDMALKVLEEARAEGKIGDPSGAVLSFKVSDPKVREILSTSGAHNYFKVSGLSVTEGEDSVTLEVASGCVCPRCRLHFESDMVNEKGLCYRCADAVKGLDL
ncbi:MAG: isoleucine--tRNA ligase [Bacilli bacterium]|nr:isoleucine--tRNA ligase [Bacilli bacterium]